MPDDQTRTEERQKLVESVSNNPTGRVKVAVSDIDGVLRGKYITSTSSSPPSRRRLRLLRRVFGWDMHRPVLRQHDAHRLAARLSRTRWRARPGTHRNVPWDGDVPFFLGEFVKATATPHPLCPRQTLKRVLARAEKMGFTRDGAGWSSSGSTSSRRRRVGRQEGRAPGADHAGHVRLLAAARQPNREYFNALMDEMAPSACRSRACTPRPVPASTRRDPVSARRSRQADRAILFKTGAKEIGARFGIMPSFMAKWSAQYPGCSRPHPPEPEGRPTARRTCSTTRRAAQGGMSPLFESYVAGQVACLMEFAPMFWPTINSYKRLVDGFWAPVKPTWGIDNRTASFRVLPGRPRPRASRRAARART
jgi:glutamine synthetase